MTDIIFDLQKPPREVPRSKNKLAFCRANSNKALESKMHALLKFVISCWRSLLATGLDMFGTITRGKIFDRCHPKELVLKKAMAIMNWRTSFQASYLCFGQRNTQRAWSTLQ